MPVDSRGSRESDRVLMLTGSIPSPDGIGSQKRAWNHLKVLRRVGNTVDLVLLLNEAEFAQRQELSTLIALCGAVIRLKVSRSDGSHAMPFPGMTLLRHVMGVCRPRIRIEDESGLKVLRGLLKDHVYDLAFCFRLQSFLLLRQLEISNACRIRRRFVDFDDVESVFIDREKHRLGSSMGLERRMISSVSRRVVAREERYALVHVDGVGVCSYHDARELRRRCATENVMVIPNALPDPGFCAPCALRVEGRFLLLGSLNYGPNVDAAEFFAQEILPIIRGLSVEDVSFSIVGRRPSQAVAKLALESGVTVTADPEIVRPFYEEADVVVVPIRFGGGTRVKIIEAMANGRPVVSTSIGAEGLDLLDGEEVLIADEPQAFAEACLRLISDRELWQRLVRAGRNRFLRSYESASVEEKAVDALQELMLAEPR